MGIISVPSAFDTQPQYLAPLVSNSLTKGLRGFWMPAGDGIALPINRVTGNRSAGISGSVVPGAAPQGRIYTFSTGNIDTGEVVSIAGSELTIAIKVRFPSSNTLRLFGNHGQGSTGYLLHQSGLGVGLYLDAVSIATSSNLTAGVWGQVAFSFVGGNKLISVNGVVTTTSGSVSVSAQSGTVKLGAYNWTGFPDFTGDAEYFAVWDRGLSSSELRAWQANPYSNLQAPDEEIWIIAGSGVALASSALASSTGAAALSVAIPIIGASAVSTTGQGTLSVALPLAAAGAASVVGSATLNTNQALASSAAANTTGQGTLGVAQAIAGSGIATAQGTGSLSLSIPINSAALANVIGSGTLNGSLALAAAAVAGVLGQGNLSLSIALSAAAIANAIGSGNLGVSGSFESHAVASAAGQGTLTQRIPISGASLSATNGSGSLTQLVPISGSSVVLANGQGALHLTINMNAAALAQAMGVGNLTLRLTLSGHGLANAIGSATLGGMHRPVNPEFFITGNSVVRYVLGNALIRSL